ncbi:MAG: transcriptional regulator [Deltaproteobacteria bacterium]|nr:transcriptional regulator [Deltaproteobacteria bacterium]
MGREKKAKTKFKKIVSEQFPVNHKKGGGILKIEVWENEKREIVKYSMAYINHLIFSDDNGRVIGYDNTHNFHHKHYFGEISEVSDFISYQNLVDRFEKEIKEFIK